MSQTTASANTSSSGQGPIWSLPSLIEYFRSDDEIAKGITEEELNSFINYSHEWVTMVKVALEYQGFDPRVILTQMLRNRASYLASSPATISWDLTNVSGDLEVTTKTKPEHKFTNEESLAKDVNFLITIFLSRNNHIGKVLKKARDGVSGILEMLKEKYNIDDEVRASGTSIGSRVITLPRIAGVFPATAVRMFHDRVVKEIVSYDSFPGTVKPDTHAICCPLLPSIIPSTFKNVDSNNFHPVALWAAVRLDEIIHRKEKDVTPLMDLLSYYRAAYQSNAMPDKAREKVFSYLGLTKKAFDPDAADKKVLTDSCTTLAASCLGALGKMRVDDPSHDLLMKVAKSGEFHQF